MSDKQIDAIRRALGVGGQTFDTGVIYAKIKSVDAEKRTCVVVDDLEMQYDDVLLYSVENADLKGWVVLPKVDSVVLVGRIGDSNELYVAMMSEIDGAMLTIGDKVEASIDDKELKYKNDKVELTITSEKVSLKAEKIEFNGGDNKGLVKIEQLTEKVNAMIETFNSHTHTLITGSVQVEGMPAKQANVAPITVPAIIDKAQKLNKTDYENDKITH